METGEGGRRPTRLVLTGIALFTVAVFLARLLLAGGAAWVAFALLVPLVLFVLTARVGLRGALVVTAAFVLVVLALRWVLGQESNAWIALLLLPVVAFTALLVGRVLGQMRRDRQAQRDDGDA